MNIIYIALYCTDIAETVQAPVFHVNADEPEMVDMIMRMALDYRQTFHKDVVIDIIGKTTNLFLVYFLHKMLNIFINIFIILGYRKFGHNELD